MQRWFVGAACALVGLLAASSGFAAPLPLRCPSAQTASIAVGDPPASRLGRDDIQATCVAPKNYPGNVAGAFRYKAFTYRNRTAAAACVNVTLTATSGELGTAAYLGAFNPTDLAQNYLGDPGQSATASTSQTYSVTVPSLQTFIVMVDEVVDGQGGAFSLSVVNCGDVVVTQVDPSVGPTIGGTSVTVHGAGFLKTATVSLGGALMTGLSWNGEDAITGTSAPHAAGVVDVVVDNQDGTTSTLAGAFTYVTAAPTTVSLGSSANPSVASQAVTFTADVSGTNPPHGPPTGTVTFADNGVAIGTGAVDASGVASVSTSTLAVGSHTVTAAYGGDTFYLASAAPALVQTVNQATTSVALISSQNPSIPLESVTFTASVSVASPGGGTPTGTVTFADDATPLGTVAVDANGQATLAASALAVGSHPVTATYSGDANDLLSASATLTETVSAVGTVETITSTMNPSTPGASVTFNATITPSGAGPAPTGSVTFADGSNVLGTVVVSGAGTATFSLSSLATGTHAITAAYGGDAVNLPATASMNQVVGTAATTTVLVSSVNPSGPGQAVTFTATVTPSGVGTIGGTVTFRDGTTVLGTFDIVMSAATFTANALSLGGHVITATYTGDRDFSASTSPALTQTVQDGSMDAGADAGAEGGAEAGADGGVDAGAGDDGSVGCEAGSDACATIPTASFGGCGCRAAGTSSTPGSPGTLALAIAGACAVLARRRRRRS